MLPSQISDEVSLFDRFAERAARFVARAPFFAACVILVALWAPSILVLGDLDTWQLIINTTTTIITFLMVALLENSSARQADATQHKLNALARGLADVLQHIAETAPPSRRADVYSDLRELEHAVGLEARESS